MKERKFDCTKNIVRNYATADLTIVWQPALCTHAGVCWRMLPKVYRPAERPWVRPEFATTEQLIEQVDACPSGALTYRMNDPHASK